MRSRPQRCRTPSWAARFATRNRKGSPRGTRGLLFAPAHCLHMDAADLLDSSALDAEGRGYPRPQLRRPSWISLNGEWQFAFDPDAVWHEPSDVVWTETIRVPFAPEAPASGLGHTGFLRACWYKKRIVLPSQSDGGRWLLHFGAVDYTASVWINGVSVGGHEGGYTPFFFDITSFAGAEVCEI